MAKNKYPPCNVPVMRVVGQLVQSLTRMEQIEPTMSNEELVLLDTLKDFENFVYKRTNRVVWARLTMDLLVLFDDTDFA